MSCLTVRPTPKLGPLTNTRGTEASLEYFDRHPGMFDGGPEKLEETAAEYGMEIGSDKSKILVNSIKPIPSTNIQKQMNGQTLDKKWTRSNT